MPSFAGAVPPAQHLRRLREITTVLVKYGFPDLVARLRLERTVALGRRLRPWARRQAPAGTRAQRFRQALEELGPSFVKFGQALSTRPDLLPADLVAELSRLQDAVPPLPPGTAQATIEAELGVELAQVFSRFDDMPVAAASIAQVHRARLLDGSEVAVKVRRPGTDATIEQDLGLLLFLARLAERYLPDADLYQPATLVGEFARAIRREQDLAREGRTIERFARNFAGDSTIRLPRVHWPQTTAAVLTMEYIEGRKVLDVLAAPGAVDPRLVARRGAEILLKQVLRDGLFHADPHPSNVFVLPDNVICLLDFGSVGRIDDRLRDGLVGAVDAVVAEDPDRLVRALLAIGQPLEPTDLRQLRRDLVDLLDGYAGILLKDLSVGALLQDALAVMRKHRLQFPADLILLVRAFVATEGMGRRLDPSFNMVEHARPVIAGILRDRLSPSAVAARVGEVGREVTEVLQSLPRDLVEVIGKARDDRLQIQFVHRNLERFVQEMDRSSNRLSFAIVIAALVVGSSFILQRASGPHLFGLPAVGLVGFVAAAVLGLWLAVGILRSGRL
jgi:ubiquinone biosynthesis protein